jgi:hypothetical protein
MEFMMEMPAHPGIVRYDEITLDAMPDVSIPPIPEGPVVDVPEEDPPRSPFRSPESPDVDDVDDVDEPDEPGEVRLFSVLGTVETSFDSADCAPPLADVPAPFTPCAANPARLVVSGGGVSGVTPAVIAAEFAA